jgi:limonene-1,2-epoxide hydrolase
MALLKRKRSGLTDPMSVVTRFVNACNRHDADSVAACLHPDFDSIQPMYPSRNFRGADQVRRNWQAIFDAEPGFRLTVLRQAAADDTVWLELHGAGREAEVAGVFVMGIQGDRIRWARIYSALIEPLAPGMEDPAASSPATLREVPPLGEPSDGAPVAEAAADEDLIAPVVDIEGGGRSRRRGSSRRRSRQLAEAPVGEPMAEPPPVEGPAEPAAVAEEPEAVDAAPALPEEPEEPGSEAGAEPGAVAAADPGAGPEPVPEGDPVLEAAPPAEPVPEGEPVLGAAEVAPDLVVVVGTGPEGVAPAPDAHAEVAEAAPQVVVMVEAEPEARAGPGPEAAEPVPDAAAPDPLEGREPEVVAEPPLVQAAEPEPEPAPEPPPEPAPAPERDVPQGRFGGWRGRKKR